MTSIILTFIARCMLIALFFPFSALDKILNSRMAVAQAGQVVRPEAFARIFIAMGFVLEISMSLAILTGVADRLAALIFAAYCVATAALWKQFWRTPDFRLKGESAGRDVFWDFLKNIALAGGFLLLAFGSTAAGVQEFFHHPLASSHPYALASAGDHAP